MSKIAIIGEAAKITGFGLTGAIVLPAEEPAAVQAAWRSLSSDVAIVLLTARAAGSLVEEAASWPLTVVMPP